MKAGFVFYCICDTMVNMEPTQSKPNTYNEKREEKVRKEAGQEKKKKIKTVIHYIIAALVIAGVIAGIAMWAKSLAPKGEDHSKGFSDFGQNHIPEGSQRPDYNSDPPTSGPHYPDPAKEKFYNKEIPDEFLVHNLEHGDIWISYNPRISDTVKNELKKFADDSKVIITLRPKNEFDISLAAWIRLDSFNVENGVLDEVRIDDFIKRYKNRGPEKVPGGMGGREF